MVRLQNGTSKGLERVNLEGLLPNFREVHLELRADVIFLEALADLKDFVCDALWRRTWERKSRPIKSKLMPSLIVVDMCHQA